MNRRVFLLVAFSLTFTFGCNKSNENPKDYTGEALFKGIFLLEGEVSEKLPYQSPFGNELKKLFRDKPDFEKLYRQKTDELVKKVNDLDPSFFTNLKSAVASKNVSELEYNLRRGNELISAITLPEIQSSDARLVEEVMSTINIKNYDIKTNEGLEKYLAEVQEKFKNLPISKQTGNSPQNIAEGRCVIVVVFIALAGWHVLVAINAIAAINAALVINVAAAINVIVAINTYNATNSSAHYNGDTILDVQEMRAGKFEHEKRIQEIFNVTNP